NTDKFSAYAVQAFSQTSYTGYRRARHQRDLSRLGIGFCHAYASQLVPPPSMGRRLLDVLRGYGHLQAGEKTGRADSPPAKHADHPQPRRRIAYQPLRKGADEIRSDDLASRIHSEALSGRYPFPDAQLFCV